MDTLTLSCPVWVVSSVRASRLSSMKVYVGVTSVVELSHWRLFEQGITGQPWGRIARDTHSGANSANRRVAIDPQPTAFPHMGDWYLGLVSPSSLADEVPGGSHWVLHQVDRSWAHRIDHGPQGSALCVEEHSLSFWNPKAFSVWQWYPICKSAARQTMHRTQHEAGVRLRRTLASVEHSPP